MLKRILWGASLFLVVILGLWGALFVNIPNIHQEHHQAYLSNLQEAEKHFAQLQAETLRTRFGEVQHYDFVQHHYIELQRNVNALNQLPSFVDSAVEQGIQAHGAVASEALVQMELLLSDFQRANSLLRNSVAYLPTFIRSLQALSDNEKTRNLLDLLEKQALSFYVYQDSANAKLMNETLSQYMSSANLPHQATTLPIHIDVLQIYSKQARDAMQKMANLPLLKELSQIQRAYADEFDRVNAYREQMIVLSEALLLVFVIGLLAIFAYAVIKAQRQLKELFDEALQQWGRGNFAFRMSLRHDDRDVIVNQMNELFDRIGSAHREIERVTSALAKGDFEQRIEQRYDGELESLKQGVNGAAQSVHFMMSELANVMQGLHQGNFSLRMNEQVPGVFRQQVDSALQSIQQIVREINTAMTAMSQGDFSVRVMAEAAGEFVTMKQAVNQTISVLDQMTAELVLIANAQAMGDLTSLARIQAEGRLQELQQAGKASSTKVKEVIGQVLTTANAVSSAAEQVLASANHLAERIQVQAHSVEQTASAMTLMASAVEENTQGAQTVSSLAQQVKTQSLQGMNVMQQTIAAMQAIRESSYKISDIVSLIDSIAFQTNLLALNAAVEAARAGEHGRGFAVVASEVRALAAKSADAAKDIKSLIVDSVHRIETGTELADKSGEMLNDITQSVNQVALMIDQMALASQAQHDHVNRVKQAMQSLDKVTQDNTQVIESTKQVAIDLSEESQHLKGNIGFFRLA